MSQDSSYKLLFSHPEMVEDLLRGYVHQAWVQQLDFSTLEQVEGSYVSDTLKHREQDLVWRVRWVGQDRWLYVYLLLEFQSSPDRSMALRLLTYLCLLYQTLLRQRQPGDPPKLPPVLPLVLYNGEARWSTPLELHELIDTIPGELEQFRPAFRYLLIDENDHADTALPEHRNLVAALFGLEQSRGPDQLREVLVRLIDWVATPERHGLRRALTLWMNRILLPAKFPGVDFDELEDLSEVKVMLAQRVKNWTAEWERQGWERGLAQGIEQGISQGETQGMRETLLRLVSRRFGPVVSERTAQVLSSVSDRQRLEQLADQILDCPDAQHWLALLTERNGAAD